MLDLFLIDQCEGFARQRPVYQFAYLFQTSVLELCLRNGTLVALFKTSVLDFTRWLGWVCVLESSVTLFV